MTRRTGSITRLAAMLAGVAAVPAIALAQAPSANTLVIGYGTDASTLDPDDISSRDTANIAQHIFGTLFQITEEGKIVPYLAESYTESEDGTKLTFKLNSGLTCHDGEALTAEDVVYSFKRAADPNMKFTGNTPGFVFSSLGYKDARVVDDLTAEISIAKYNPIALGMVAEVYIHCKDSYEKMTKEQAAQKPIGSGPYKFVEWVRSDRIVIEKVPGFKLRPANFDKVVWRVIPEASTRTAELLAGNVDIITNVAPDQIATVNKSTKAKVAPVSGTRRIYIGFNQKDIFANTPGGKAIQNPAVRRALQYAVDVPAICEQLLNTTCKRATGLVNPPNDNPELQPYPFDPKMAEKLLDEAGYPKKDGVRFEITLQSPRGRYLNDANVALAVGQYLTDVGVKTKVELMEWASVYTPLIRKKEAGPMFLLGSGGGTWNALYDMADLSTPSAGTNYTNWDDPDFFSGWAELATKKPLEEQRKTINRMLKVFYEKGPWLLMYFQPDFYGVSTRIDWKPRRDEKIYINEAKLK
ncbi:ABC transporter substrate-binding protein [Alsobacter sp. R-9]